MQTESRRGTPARGVARGIARAALRAAPALLFLLVPVRADSGDLETQAWGNLTLGWIRSEKVYLELDLEPKVLVSGDPQWRNLDVTPAVEYYPSPWVDLVGEMVVGTTLQTDDLRTTELTVRGGARVHFVQMARGKLQIERTPLGRISAATLVRLEERNFWYSDNTDSQQSFRFRVRLELKAPINHANLAMDRTWYVLADAEGYVPVGDEVDERFATKLRGRVGLGYRIDERHRVDLLYIRDRQKDTIDDTPTDSSQAIDLRYRVVF
jgi:hypothetical protein